MSSDVKRAQKFTISLPRPLYEEGESERHRLGKSRSEFVADLYRAYVREAERQRRIERYRIAYERFPSSPEEDALIQESMRILGSESV